MVQFGGILELQGTRWKAGPHRVHHRQEGGHVARAQRAAGEDPVGAQRAAVEQHDVRVGHAAHRVGHEIAAVRLLPADPGRRPVGRGGGGGATSSVDLGFGGGLQTS